MFAGREGGQETLRKGVLVGGGEADRDVAIVRTGEGAKLREREECARAVFASGYFVLWYFVLRRLVEGAN